MTLQAAVVTAIYDSYDELKPTLPQAGALVDWVCVTDDPDLKDGTHGWRVIHEPRPGLHPNRAAKRAKFEPWRYTAAPASVWVDASFRVVSEHFVTSTLSHADPIAQFVHPWRDCLHDEAAASAPLPKYEGEPVQEQADMYWRSGHPEHWGLWATGIIARQHTEAVQRLGAAWWQEVERWSFQDQISQPYVLHALGLRPASLPGSHIVNDWLVYQGSERHG